MGASTSGSGSAAAGASTSVSAGASAAATGSPALRGPFRSWETSIFSRIRSPMVVGAVFWTRRYSW